MSGKARRDRLQEPGEAPGFLVKPNFIRMGRSEEVASGRSFVHTIEGREEYPKHQADGLDTLQGLHPDHLADLKKSGLNDEIIISLGIHSIPPREIPRIINDPRVESLLCFPYPGLNGFCRWKIFPSGLTDKEGHKRRYHQKAGSGVHLYIPPLAQKVLSDPTTPLYFVEGEKKAAKGCQEGYPTIGLGGLWNWVCDGEPIEELDQVKWEGRHVFLVPDSDAWLDRDDLLHAVYALGSELECRGAYVRMLKISPKGGEE